uniref:Uncharacterized protein n=1 Tax=Anguilla anguilla TaxID=7936 RepID=A0A0E9UGS9_ANGAN
MCVNCAVRTCRYQLITCVRWRAKKVCQCLGSDPSEIHFSAGSSAQF